jgi:hypothetical protein
VSVYLSVAPPDGFTRWKDAEWDRWLREHPWEAAERLCSRGDWAVFLYQLRQHCPAGKKGVEPVLEQLVNERPLTSQQAADLRDALGIARGELQKVPAQTLQKSSTPFASAEDLEAMISAARARLGRDPNGAELWSEVFDQLQRVLDRALEQKRGVYFGNV